jgi:2-amino-4-hydroxy-6-hydroxymethyldihydropteridine diphosphokinase
VYETEPVGYTDQPVFWNMALRARTSLGPAALLAALKRCESELGREPGFRMGPRVIDIDVLLYDDVVLQTPALTLPHGRLLERPFALVPLLELDAELRDPRTGVLLADLPAARDHAGMRRLGAASAVLQQDVLQQDVLQQDRGGRVD